jgi:hypothetical protein
VLIGNRSTWRDNVSSLIGGLLLLWFGAAGGIVSVVAANLAGKIIGGLVGGAMVAVGAWLLIVWARRSFGPSGWVTVDRDGISGGGYAVRWAELAGIIMLRVELDDDHPDDDPYDSVLLLPLDATTFEQNHRRLAQERDTILSDSEMLARYCIGAWNTEEIRRFREALNQLRPPQVMVESRVEKE